MVTNGKQDEKSDALSLTVYERIADPMASAKIFGEAISKSGMFGEVKPYQGMILALECISRRMPPLMLAETYHLIGSKLSMRSEKMLANFNEAGGKHRIISRTSDLVSIELTYDGQKNVFSLSWEEAKQEPFVYDEKEGTAAAILAGTDEKKKAALKIKKKYATPRARMQMLWARVISDGVNAVMPSAKQGCYTPEEVMDYLEGEGKMPAGKSGQDEAIDADYTVATGGQDAEQENVEVTEESSETLQADELTAVEPTPASDDGFATSEQSSRLVDLYSALSLTAEQIEKALAKRGAHSNRSLKFEAAAELITTLEGKLAQVQAVQQQTIIEAVGESRQNPDNVTTNPGGPATPEQVADAKKLLGELEQVKPGSVNRFKAHINANGIEKLADLSAGDCQALLDGLAKKTMEAFFDRSLTSWKAKQQATADAPFDGGTVPSEAAAKN